MILAGDLTDGIALNGNQVIDSLLNLLFRCSHSRMTRPMTPAKKAGEPGAETYVVCLECGKQFLYDMKEMRVGKAVPVSPHDGVLYEDTPPPKTKKLRNAAVASAVPIAFVAFKWLKKGDTRKGGDSEADEK